MRRRRNKRLIEKRNAKIAARYYYWTEVQRLRSDDAIRQLSEDDVVRELSEAAYRMFDGENTSEEKYTEGLMRIFNERNQ